MKKKKIIGGLVTSLAVTSAVSFMPNTNIEIENSTLKDNDSNINNIENEKKVILNEDLNLRESEEIKDGNILFTMRKGSEIELLSSLDSDWVKVRCGNREGYALSEYINDIGVNAKTSNDTYSVTTTNLNIRSGAGTKYSVLGTLKQGAKISVISINNGWAKFTYNNRTAYVSYNHLKKVETPSSTVSNSSNASTITTSQGKVTANSLNVRAGAGTNYSKLGSLKKNATVEIVDISGGWYKIKYGSGYGYVSSSHITKTSTNTNTSTNTSNSNNSSNNSAVSVSQGKVTANELNVRAGAGTQYSILGKLKKNETVEIMSTSGSWDKIKYGSSYGYVSSSYVTKTNNNDNTNNSNVNSNNNTNTNANTNVNNNNNNNNSNNNTNNNSTNNTNNNNTNNDSLQYFKNEVLRLVNIERAKEGLCSLTMDSKLSKVAQIKSQEMVDYNYFAHNSPVSGTPFELMKSHGITYKVAGENLAKAYSNPEDVVKAWMDSAGHRKNIMNPRFTHLGMGIAKTSSGVHYWAQMFTGQK